MQTRDYTYVGPSVHRIFKFFFFDTAPAQLSKTVLSRILGVQLFLLSILFNSYFGKSTRNITFLKIQLFSFCHHGLQEMPSWSSRYAIMDFKVCHHGHQGTPSLSPWYAMRDFMICHDGLHGMPSWTSRFAIEDFKVSHQGLQGLPSRPSRFAIKAFKVCHHGLQGMPSWTITCHLTFWSCLFSSCVHSCRI